MDDGSKQALLSGIRSLLIASGAALTAKGFIDATAWNQVVGAIMTILPIAWGVWDKFQSEILTKKREAVALNVGIAVADRTVGVTPGVQDEHVPAVIKAYVAAAAVMPVPAGVVVSPNSPILSPVPEAAPVKTAMPFGVAVKP